MLPSQIMILMAIAISSTGADTLIRQMDIAVNISAIYVIHW